MEVNLIAMTDAVFDYGFYKAPIGNSLGAEQVCNFATRTCTSEDAGELLEPGYPGPRWTTGLDMKPLRTALKSGHESVLEHAVYTFEIKGVSRVLETQLVRHRIGASFSIQSGRYNARDPTNYVIPFDTEVLDDEIITEFNNALRELDDHLKAKGIKEEDRRYFYPQGLTTNIVMTMNARELLHYFSLRLCTRAQKEHRELAEKMLAICKKVSPIIFENAGPSCVRDGFCREQRSCGRAPKLERVLEVMDEMDCEESIRDEQRTAERECHRCID